MNSSSLRGQLEVLGDRDTKCFSDPVPALVGGQRVMIDRQSLLAQDGIQDGDELIVGPPDQSGICKVLRSFHSVQSSIPMPLPHPSARFLAG